MTKEFWARVDAPDQAVWDEIDGIAARNRGETVEALRRGYRRGKR